MHHFMLPLLLCTLFGTYAQFISPKMLLLVRIRVKNHRPVDALPLGEHADRLVDPDLN